MTENFVLPHWGKLTALPRNPLAGFEEPLRGREKRGGKGRKGWN